MPPAPPSTAASLPVAGQQGVSLDLRSRPMQEPCLRPSAHFSSKAFFGTYLADFCSQRRNEWPSNRCQLPSSTTVRARSTPRSLKRYRRVDENSRCSSLSSLIMTLEEAGEKRAAAAYGDLLHQSIVIRKTHRRRGRAAVYSHFGCAMRSNRARSSIASS